eukprot:gene45410-56566_t
MKPCREPSNSEMWVTRQLAGSESGSTAKPWFWDVIITLPRARAGSERHDLVAQVVGLGGGGAAAERLQLDQG